METLFSNVMTCSLFLYSIIAALFSNSFEGAFEKNINISLPLLLWEFGIISLFFTFNRVNAVLKPRQKGLTVEMPQVTRKCT